LQKGSILKERAFSFVGKCRGLWVRALLVYTIGSGLWERALSFVCVVVEKIIVRIIGGWQGQAPGS
jgi:hypothetical protein